MAKPRVFVSSTYYDLKNVRSSLENFVESLGYEPVLSEKGDIAYAPEVPLDESCYREARNADIFVMIIGGRYGTEASSDEKKPNREFFERYDSITKKEYANAVSEDIPIYILIENNVESEYRTFLKNKEKKDIQYAHVDSVNVFYLIEHILSQPRNNPVCTFERYSDIEVWLREQWAGFFRELLDRRSSQERIKTLSSQVGDLTDVSETLKKYLEEVVSKISPKEAAKLIEEEEKRLEKASLFKELAANPFVEYLQKHVIELADIHSAMAKCRSVSDFGQKLEKLSQKEGLAVRIRDLFQRSERAQRDFNEARGMLGLAELGFTSSSREMKEVESGEQERQ